jgi:hypothetical protein
VVLLHFSHFHHVSLVQWTNCLLPATGGSGSCPGGATHTSELGLLLALSRYSGEPDVIPDHWLWKVDRSSLLAVFAATLATLLVPVPFSLQATDYGNIPLGSHKGVTGGETCGTRSENNTPRARVFP